MLLAVCDCRATARHLARHEAKTGKLALMELLLTIEHAIVLDLKKVLTGKDTKTSALRIFPSNFYQPPLQMSWRPGMLRAELHTAQTAIGSKEVVVRDSSKIVFNWCSPLMYTQNTNHNHLNDLL